MRVLERSKRVVLTACVIAALGIGLNLAGCASIQSTSISEIAKGPGHRLRAVDTAHGFLMLSMPDLDGVAKLKAQCAGSLTGIQTVTWMRNWLVVQHYHQEVMGWCQNF